MKNSNSYTTIKKIKQGKKKEIPTNRKLLMNKEKQKRKEKLMLTGMKKEVLFRRETVALFSSSHWLEFAREMRERRHERDFDGCG